MLLLKALPTAFWIRRGGIAITVGGFVVDYDVVAVLL